MILTVTLNPLLEHRLIYQSVELGKGFRCEKEYFYAGGKGINVSRQLNQLKIPNHAVTFLGGNNGKLLRHCLTEDKIDFTIVSSKAETRIAEIIVEEEHKRVSTFFGFNSQITKQESEEFKNKLDKMIQNCSIVVFSGSSPCKETDDIFPFGIKLANEYDKTSILDTYGNHLQDCLDACPTVIHNNISEIEKTVGVNLQSEQSKLEYLKSLYKKGVKLSFLTDGKNAAYASKFDYIYKVDPIKIDCYDATGSGDAFVAGVAYGLENSMVFEEFLKIAVALGTANATMLETCNVSLNEYEKYLDAVNILPIGKKMKLIDDSPNY